MPRAARPQPSCGLACSTARERQRAPVPPTRLDVQRAPARGRSRAGRRRLTDGRRTSGRRGRQPGAHRARVRSGGEGRSHRRGLEGVARRRRRSRRRGALVPGRRSSRTTVWLVRGEGERRRPHAFPPGSSQDPGRPTRACSCAACSGSRRGSCRRCLAGGHRLGGRPGHPRRRRRLGQRPGVPARCRCPPRCDVAGSRPAPGSRCPVTLSTGRRSSGWQTRRSASSCEAAASARATDHVAVVGSRRPIAARGGGRPRPRPRASPRRGSIVVSGGAIGHRCRGPSRRARRRRDDGRRARLGDRRRLPCRATGSLLRAIAAARHDRRRVSAGRPGRTVPVPGAQPADRRAVHGVVVVRGREHAAAPGSPPSTRVRSRPRRLRGAWAGHQPARRDAARVDPRRCAP